MFPLPLTSLRLLAIMPRSEKVISQWVGPFEQAMAAFGIDTPDRAAMFFANIAHESAELTQLEESFAYRSSERLRKVFPRFFLDDTQADAYLAAGGEAIANLVYANRMGNGDETSGDGWAYRGRGPIGLTFKNNYRSCSLAICGDADTLVKNPEFVMLPEFGAASAAWYWDAVNCNVLADAGDFDGVCDLINLGRKTSLVGDSNGFEDRSKYLERARKAFG